MFLVENQNSYTLSHSRDSDFVDVVKNIYYFKKNRLRELGVGEKKIFHIRLHQKFLGVGAKKIRCLILSFNQIYKNLLFKS